MSAPEDHTLRCPICFAEHDCTARGCADLEKRIDERMARHVREQNARTLNSHAALIWIARRLASLRNSYGRVDLTDSSKREEVYAVVAAAEVALKQAEKPTA